MYRLEKIFGHYLSFYFIEMLLFFLALFLLCIHGLLLSCEPHYEKTGFLAM